MNVKRRLVRRMAGGMININMNRIETKRFYRFQDIHYKICKSGAPKLELSFTGIGIGYHVRCPKCNRCRDITDYSCW